MIVLILYIGLFLVSALLDHDIMFLFTSVKTIK